MEINRQQTKKTTKKAKSIYISDVKEGFPMLLKVMVTRKWNMFNEKNEFISTDFLLSDIKGDIIHCFAKSYVSSALIDKLQEGTVYTIRDFILQRTNNEYTIVKDASYITEICDESIVRKSNVCPNQFTRYPFQFIDYESIQPTEKKYLYDVIGQVSEINNLHANPQDYMSIEFELINIRDRRMKCILHKKLGDLLLRKMHDNYDNHVVILTSMIASYNYDQSYLSSTSSTIIIDNPGIPCIQQFHNQMRKPVHLPMQLESRSGTVAELLEIGRAKKTNFNANGMLFIVTVEIVGMRTKDCWHNLTCTNGQCMKGIYKKENHLWCIGCESRVAFPSARYRIQLDVKDDTGSFVLVCFDGTADHLTKTTVNALLNELLKEDNEEDITIPSCISSLTGTTHTIELNTISYYNCGDYETFNCNRIIPTASSEKKWMESTQISTPRKNYETRKRKM